jgi:uncharacterized phage protein gp47/JayE
MTDQLTSTGLTIDSLETRRADVVTALRAAISSILDVSPDQPTGQITDIYLERLQTAIELVQELYASLDPAQATGQSLDAICSITGTYRRAATQGTVTLRLNLNAATTVPAGSQAAVSGDADNIWITDEAVTSVGAGNYDVTATAQTAGAIEAPAGTITVIVTPVAGWNSVTNIADATEGLERETDAELRARRVNELFQGGSTSSQGIQAAVSALTWVEEAIVYANDYWRAVAPMPPHSIEVVIDKSTNLSAAEVAELAELIYEEKASGIQAYGSNIGNAASDPSTTHTDDQGNIHVISWTRATQQDIEVAIDISTSGDYDSDYIGNAALQTAVAASINDNTIGEDVIYNQLIATVINQTGINNITSLTCNISGDPPGTIDLPIGAREISIVSNAVANITVTS